MSDSPVSDNFPPNGLSETFFKNQASMQSLDEFLSKFTKNEHEKSLVNLLKEISVISPNIITESIDSVPLNSYKQKVNPNMSSYPVVSVSPNQYKTVIYPHVSPEGEPMEINLFINHNTSFPHNVIVIDYLNSGELFCNLSEVSLENALPTLGKLYASYLNRSEFVNPDLPVGYTSNTLPYAVTCLSPTNSFSIAWTFPLDKFFSYTHVPKDTPICQYYTHQSTDNSVPVIISPHYKYANTVSGHHSCSHPILSENLFSCSSYNSFSSCSFYSPLQHELLSKTVASPHSSSSLDFSLTYSITSLGKHMFTITNRTINEDVNVLVYPATYSYDQCLEEATSIYHEYIEPYVSTSHIISENEKSNLSDSTKDVEKESYITSLLVG